MKKPTFSKGLVIAMLLLLSSTAIAQVLRPFGKEYDASLKGDILIIGNNVLNRDFGTAGNRANDPYNAVGSAATSNEFLNMKWINIDPDGTTNFNSSSAKLTIPAASQGCYKIAYAALYWAGTYSIAADRGSAGGADRSVINKVRLKVGTGAYTNLTGNVIYDYVGTGLPAISENNPTTAQNTRNPYACMVDVTSLVQAGGEVNYTVANIASSEGGSGSSAGHSAGWSLFVVYEDPKLPGKYITSYNGFTRIRGNSAAYTFPINGFRTIPTGPVRTKMAFATLEGDNKDEDDFMEIVGTTIGGSITERLSLPTVRPNVPNFFNSTITDGDAIFTNRVPNSLNTIGYDTGVFSLSNPSNNTLKNGENSANITLGTGSDWYYLFFTALSVETIEPEIILTKTVLDKDNKDIGGQNVTFNDVLNYVIRFQNVGNDNARNFTIEDTLPINVIFNYPTDILPLPPGVTIKSYDATTRQIIFDIDKDYVEKNDPLIEFRLRVKIVSGCNALSNACSNIIDNIAIAKYQGTIDPDSGTVLSINSNSICLAEPKATNFLVGIDGCTYATDVTLCGDSLVLTAGSGYNLYAWSKFPFDAAGLPTGAILGTAQSFTITDIGTYYVRNTAVAPCRSITQQFNVTRFGGVVVNPISNFANETVLCTNDGKLLPNIYLCGGTDFRLMQTGITGTTSIEWQRLTGGCATTANPTCASESNSCIWTTVASGPDYSADTAGEYRLVLNYSGGCFNRFYFNVYKNNFTPTAVATDIFCTTQGTIRVTNPAQNTGYEYSLSAAGPFGLTNTFPISSAGTYTAYVRQIGVPTNPCIFKVENLQVIDRKITIQEIVQQPYCKGDKGNIILNVNGVRAQYYLKVTKGVAVVANLGPQASNQFVLNNVDLGTYDYEVTTDDGCRATGSITIAEPDLLTATAAITKPLTCNNGEITVYPVGGTAPYVYYVNGSTTFQNNPQIVVAKPLPVGGLYSIQVVDNNNCKTTVTITVTDNPKPVYTVVKTDVLCYSNATGALNFNVTNPNGYSLEYSINNGTTYGTNPSFTNLIAGTYTPSLRYTLSGVSCIETLAAITISEPAAAVTASMGVSELAGCGPAREGRVRITNPQGGVAPYEYSFDNQATWSATVIDAYKAPGTYTLYIRDKNLCVYSAAVTIDPEPVAPIILVDNPVDFNCDGSATSTVTVNNPGPASFSYDYFLDSVKNTNVPNNVFVNVLPGTHAIRIEYKVNTVPTFSNLLTEDFGKGTYTTSPGINPAYCFEDESILPHLPSYKCNKDRWINDGEYAVASSIVTNFGGAWILNPKDHTAPTSSLGRFLCVNVGGSAGVGGVLYSKPITNVIPNQDVKVSIWALNLIVSGRPLLGDPDLTIQLWKDYGLPTAVQVGASVNTGNVPKTQKWENYNLTINPGNNTDLTFLVRSNSTVINGNDVLIDDINVFQLPKACVTVKDYTITVPTGKSFSAQITGFKNVKCATDTNGEITIAAQNFDPIKGYQYSIDNGATWITTTTSPLTISSLAAATYNVQIRPDATAAAACVKSYSQPISAPLAIGATTAVTTLATCTTGATITTTATGGTPAYEYELRNSGGLITIVPYQLNNQFTGVAPGNYTIFIRDANSCVNPVSIPVTVVVPTAFTAVLDPTSDLCYDTVNQASLIVAVTGGVGPFTYKLNSNAAQNSPVFNGMGPGTHTIVVTDASTNCTQTIAGIVIAPQLQFAATLAQDLTCLVPASINTTIAGGYGAPYTYTVSYNAGAPTAVTTFPYATSDSGTYVFTVTDSKGCMATSNTITVTPKTTPTITTSKTEITCNNANDGTITVTASGGFTSAYTYAIKLSTAATYGTPQTTNQFTGLSAGIYDVKVIDSKGCPSLPVRVTIVNPPIVSASIAATDIGCSPTGTVAAVVTVTATGGTGISRYSFNGTTNFTTSNTYSTTVAGTVTAYIRDANNCQIGPLSVTIVAPESFTSITVTDNGYDCSTTPAGGHVNIAAAGVSAPKRYSIISGPAGFDTTENSDGEFKGLAPGAYVFQVRDTKTNCTLTRAFTVKGTPDIVAGGSVIAPINCFGGTGTIQFTVSGLQPDPTKPAHKYDYVVTNTAGATVDSNNNQSAPTITIANLPATGYTIVVKDRTTDCTATYTINLSQPTAALAINTAVATNVNCNNDVSQISVTASGGTPNYTYAYRVAGSTTTLTYASGNVLNIDTTNGTVLSWDVYVKDANGCPTSRTVTIISDALPAITSVTVPNQCSASGSTFTITATPSVTSLIPITFDLSATGSFTNTTGVFTVAAGTYTVYIKDKNGCVVAAPAPITVYPQLTASAAVTKTLDCSNSPEAIISGSITGGRSPFTIVVTSGTGPGTISQPTVNTFTYTTAIASAYTFTITDANGCPTTTSATVTAITNPTVAATPTNVSCFGGTDGSVILAGSGGSGGYQYNFNNLGFSATATYNGLSANIAYAYQVRDSKGCVSTATTITLTQPTALVVSASATAFSCNATNVKQSAVVTIDVPTTGTSPYYYSFNGGAYSNTIRTLTVNDNGTDQTIIYSVRDGNGCITAGTPIVINRLNPPTIATITNTPIYCFPAASTTSTVTVPVTVGTGVGTLTYTITSPAAATSNTTGAANGIFTGLPGGTTYIFKVTDANDCYAIKSHNVPALTPIAVTATKLSDVDCFGNNTGSIRYNVSGFSGNYSYSVNGATAVTGQTTTPFILSSLVANTYSVVFTDETTGCTALTAVTINQPAAALAATYTTVNANCFVATSRVTVNVTAGTGTPNYFYSFSNSIMTAGTYGASNIVNLNPALSWYAWVRDAKGCTVTLPLILVTDPTPSVTASAVGQCLGAGSYTITANGTGGTGTLTYSINGGASYQSGTTFVVTTAGTYTIKVKDANGCTDDSLPVVVAPQLTLNTVLNKDITCVVGDEPARITVTPSGGSGSFTYAITTPASETSNVSGLTTGVFTTIVPGSYTFTVTDTTTGCTYTTTTAIAVTPTVTPEFTVAQGATINCYEDSTASLNITIDNTKGQAPFIVNVQNTSLGINYGTQTSGLRAGIYIVTVTDAKGCSDTETITITEPDTIEIDFDTEDLKCTDDGTGTGTNIVKGKIIINGVTGGTPSYNYYVTGINGYSDSRINITGTAFFDIVDFGLYQIRVTDANGCSALVSDIKIASPPDELVIDVNTSATCAGGSAEVKIGTALASAGPFHFAVYTGAGQTYTPPTTLPWQDEDAPNSKKTTFTGLIPGVTYTFIVFDDATDCYYYQTADTAIPSTTNLAINSFVPNNITCTSANDGNVSFDILNGNTYSVDVNYQVYEDFTNLLITGVGGTATIAAGGTHNVLNLGTLPVGSYYVLVQETTGANAGCSAISAPFNIKKSPVELSITANIIKNVNCNEDGIIAAFAKDGTAPYTYQYLLDTVLPAPIATSAGWITNTTFATSTTGNYVVYVKDAYGCIKSDDVILFQDAPPAITAAPPAICYDGSTAFTITFSGTVDPAIVGSPTYSVNGSAFQSSPSFTFNAAGTYNLVIKDGNGCEDDIDYVVHPKLELSAAVTKAPDCTLIPNAEITLTVTGGNTNPSANYTYEVSTTGGAPWTTMPTNVHSVAPVTVSTTFTFRVTDANNTTTCQTTTSIVLDPIPTTILAAPTVTDVSCNGGTDGTITVNVTAGEGPYEYQLDAGTFQTSNQFTGLAAGTTYVVTVRNAKQCILASSPITIAEPSAITASAAVTTPLSCGTGNITQQATVTVTASGGTGVLEYSFDGGANYSTVNTYTTNTPGLVSVLVRDANGCPITAAVTADVLPLDPPTNMDITGTPVYCTPVSSQTSTVTINTVTAGVGPFTYQMLSPSIINNFGSNSFAVLAPDTYVFQVTDANGCTYQESYTVAPVTPIAIVGAVINDISCNPANAGTNNGSASFTVTGVSAVGNYTVTSIVPSVPFTQTGNTVTLTGLSAGTYTVTVTDTTTGCSEDDSVTITLPAPIVFTATPTKVFCSQDVATITVSGVTGGTGVYSYAVVPGTTTAPAAGAYSNSTILTVDTNLNPLNLSWDVYVKDVNGCIAIQNVVITNDAPPTITVPTAQCYVGSPLTTNVDLVTTTYNGTKSYTVNGSVSTANPIFTAPGLYVLGIKDDNGCEAFVNYTIQPQLTLQANMTQDLTCPNPASITLVPAGGTTSYTTFEVDNGSGYAVITANPYTRSISGTYKFRVTDSQGCQAESQDVIVTPITTPTAIPATTDVSCIGSLDGTITLTPSGGIAAYEYSLNGGAYQASNVFSGLGVNTYTILVRDAKLCVSASISATIGQPTAVTATPVVTPFGCDTANAPLDAIVTITPVGGTTGYSYSFDNGATYQASASFSVNTAQTITYVVKDANGCMVSGTAVVLPYTPPTDMDLTATPIYCNTPGTVATVTVNSVTAGVGPFVFEIIAPATAVIPPSAPSVAPFSFATLAPDTYIIRVTDANGCSTTKTIIVEEADKIAAKNQVINNVYCNGGSTGIIEFSVSNYIVPANYNFSLSPNVGVMTQVGDVIRYTGVPAGPYTFTVNDLTSGCQAIVPISVSQPLLALDFTTTATKINCNKDEATITVTAFGGTVDYKYAVVVSGAIAPTAYSLSNLLTVDTNSGANMVWDVYVMDANGCIDFDSVTILTDANPIITSANPTACVSSTGTYDITVTASGFSAALQYSADGSNYQTGNVITVNAPGTYNVTVKDANGCVSTGFPITILDPLILTPTVTTPVSCANGDGVISVSTTGGSGSYEYRIDGGAWTTTTPFTNVFFGTRTIEVRDTVTTCIVGASVILQKATPITGFALAKTEVTCNGGNDGTITATLATPAPGVNDNPVYTYTLNGGTPQASNLFSGLVAGTYTVVVTSERGCTDTATITIIEPALITVPAPTVVPFGCTSGNTGNFATLTVTNVTGGSGTYLNYEFIKNGTSVYLGPNATYTEANLLGGSYVVKVYDSKGCMGTATAPIVIAPYVQLDKVNVVINQAKTCTNDENITVSATFIGGTATNLEFTVVDANATTGVNGALYSDTNTSGIFTGLDIADYLITVKNLDTNCEIQNVHYVNEPNTFDLTINNVVDVTCFNAANGSASVTLIDRVINATNLDQAGAFAYTVTGPTPSTGTTSTAGPLALTNLLAGTYTISATLTNSPFCTVSKDFTITAPNEALVISETHTEITCVAANNDGSISATAIGGWPGGYEFQLENGATIVSPWSIVSDFTALTAGTYTVKVRDLKGCEVLTTVVLNNPTPIAFTVTPSTVLLACNNDATASITVGTPTGGQGINYLYTLSVTSATPVINNGPQASPVFTNLGAGTYTVTVQDGWGCSTTSVPVTIAQPAVVTAGLSIATTATCLNSATLTLTASGGTGMYSYSTTANFAVIAGTFATTTTIAVAPGTYNYYVRDANGCTAFVTNDVLIEPVPTLQVTINAINAKINCKGDTSGVIEAKAQGGLGNYVYTLLDGSGTAITPTPTQTSPGYFTNLAVGNYSVGVSSLDCTISSSVVVISEPLLALSYTTSVVNVTCNGLANGAVTLNVVGGTGRINYAISPRLDQFFDTPTFSNLGTGTYQILVQDENGCYLFVTETIGEPAPLMVALVPGTEVQELCVDDLSAGFDVAVTGGVGPYKVAIDSIAGPYVQGVAGQSVFAFAGLTGGLHTVYVIDANTCTSEVEVLLEESVKMLPVGTVEYGCLSNSPSNTVRVLIDASITNPADVDYALDGATTFQASNLFNDVLPGFHTVTARHTNGCEQISASFEVLAFAPLAITLADGGLNEIVATATGGQGPYQYALNGVSQGTQSSYIIRESGDYTVTVTDANTCTATATRYFKYIDVCIPDYFTPNGDGVQDTWAPGCTINYKNLQFNIFDRYGREIAKYRLGEGWDGKYNGNELPSGDYWYVLKLNDLLDVREFVGHFTLYR